MTTSHGWTAPGFEGVREAFEANFTHHNEVGAAFCAYHRGHKVADLWGGIAAPVAGSAWDEDTLVLVFSTTARPLLVLAVESCAVLAVCSA